MDRAKNQPSPPRPPAGQADQSANRPADAPREFDWGGFGQRLREFLTRGGRGMTDEELRLFRDEAHSLWATAESEIRHRDLDRIYGFRDRDLEQSRRDLARAVAEQQWRRR